MITIVLKKKKKKWMNPNLNSCRCRHKCFESNYWISWISWSFNIESSLGNNIKHVNHEKRNRLYIQIIFFSHTHTYTEKILGLLNSRPPEEPKISTGKKTDIFFYFTNNNNNKKISNKFQSIQRQQKSWSKKKKKEIKFQQMNLTLKIYIWWHT